MKTLRRTAAAALCLAILLLGVSARASSSGNIYFMAVNEIMIETTPENMPMVVGGALYVPYTMLSIRDTGLNLGVSAQYSTSRRTVLVSDGRLAITFDVQSNNAYDLDGNDLRVRAVVRNSVVFLPIAWICQYFGVISYSTSPTPYGTLVRITNDAVILSDAALIDAADGKLRDNLASYQQAISEQQQPSAEPSAGQQDPPNAGPVVYLALLWGEHARSIAQQLESLGHRALFLFTPEQLSLQDDLVRRLSAAGHGIGLDLTGSTVEQCLQQAQEGSALLADIARCPAYIIRANALDEEGREQLEDEGWAVWTPTLWAGDAASASRLLGQLSSARVNYVEAVCDDQQQPMLSSALRTLSGSGYHLRQAVAPAL